MGFIATNPTPLSGLGRTRLGMEIDLWTLKILEVLMVTRNLDEKIDVLTTAFLAFTVNDVRQVREITEFVSLGRDDGNHIVLTDNFVSSRHARIEKRDQGFFLRDLRSRNGTSLNGNPVLEARLSDGDRLKFGRTEMTFTSTKEIKAAPQMLSSRNSRWAADLAKLPQVAATDMPVLINGPSGSGKELVANAIHALSRRGAGTMVSVNCSALSDSLIESELFGHVRGSFTGATHDRQGAFESARRGTLFLDEVGDLPLALQPKLLRALENQEIRPVGSDRTITTDVRILSATHHDLRHLVRQGKFREDLFFRLNVVRFAVPALVSHLEDFEDLLYFFAKQYRVGFTHAAIEHLKAHRWPGNVRELRNLVARAKAYFGSAKVEPAQIDELLEPASAPPVQQEKISNRSVLKEVECEMIRERLIANHGNQRKTSLDLGMPKSTLHDRIQTYGINVKALLATKGVYMGKR